MFFSEIIEQQNPFQFSIVSDNDITLYLTNAVLDVKSVEAQLYIRVSGKDVLLARLKPEILQCSLNVLFDLKKSPTIIAKKGNVHVCGHIVEKAPQKNQAQEIVTESVINTNKKINQLSKEHIKEAADSKEKIQKNESQASTQEISNKINPSPQQNIRKSSRLSSRRATTPAKTQQKHESTQKQSKDSKKDQKSEKKKSKSQNMLQNGRYSLKALLQNIDDDQDQDEEFSDSGEDENSDDDSEFDDEGEEDEQTISKPKKSTNKQSSKNIKRSKPEDDIQQKLNQEKKPKHQNQGQQKGQSISSALKTHFQSQIQVTEQEDSDDKKQINPSEYQQKWPENAESQIQKEANQRQQKISQLASKIKCPTKRPTI